MLMVADAQWPQLLDDLGDGQAGAGLDGVGDGQGGEHDGQVRFDGVAHAVEHGPGIEVGLGHPERLLDVPQVVIFGDDFGGRHHLDGYVGDVALEPDQGLCAGQAGLVEGAVVAADLDEPG